MKKVNKWLKRLEKVDNNEMDLVIKGKNKSLVKIERNPEDDCFGCLFAKLNYNECNNINCIDSIYMLKKNK